MRSALLACCVVLPLSGGCVTSGTHQAVVDELGKTRTELQSAHAELDTLRADLAKLRTERDALAARIQELEAKLATALAQNQQFVTKISSMGQNVEKLLGQADALTRDREKLESDRRTLTAEVDELRRLRAAAEARNAEYQQVLAKLRGMIDAGKLQVKFRGGRMIVQMSTDVLFPTAGTRLMPEAREAITTLAETMKQLPDRKFLVVGHSDSTPIHTERFPSNWELSTQRAIEVVRLMIQAGVPAEMISAAGSAEFDPIAPNDSPADKAMNRRVEIVFLPKLEEMSSLGPVASTTR